MSPVSGFANTRGSFTMRAFSGASRGTWMTEIRQNEVSGSSGDASKHPTSSAPDRIPLVPDT